MHHAHPKRRSRGSFVVLLIAAPLAVAGLWFLHQRLAWRPVSVQPMNLGPAPQDVNQLGEHDFDAVAADLYTEFSLHQEEDPLARERWFWEQRAYPADSIPADVHLAAIDTEISQARLEGATPPVWSSLGPAPLNDLTYAGQSEQDASGRALAVAIHPTNPNIIFIGAAQGGVWRSTDGGQSFASVSDSTWASLAIKTLRFAPGNPNILYAGTGEPHASTSIYGQGLFKSIDGGSNWTHLPPNGASWDFRYVSISGLRVHPTDANTLYVTTAHVSTAINHFQPASPPATGIYKSTDGGLTWSLLKAATLYTAAAGNLQGNVGFMDLELAHSNPNLLYASEYQGGIYKSTNAGVDWALITPVKAGGGANLPAAVPSFSYFDFQSAAFFILNRFTLLDNLPEFSRIELGLAQSNPDVLYAGYALPFMALDPDNDGNPDDAFVTQTGLLFKTANGGTNWSWLGDWGRQGVPDYCATQCGYDNTVEVNPANANDVAIGGSANYNFIWPDPPNNPTQTLRKPWTGMVHRSLDGGVTWVDTTPHCAQYGTDTGSGRPCLQMSPSKVIHPDVHAIAYNPHNSSQLFVANDGGLYRATVSGSGASSADYAWANLNAGLSTLQFYFFDVHPTDPNQILGGLQDNAVAYWNGTVWEGWGFGDGAFGAFDPLQPNYVYMGTQFNVHRHDSGGAKHALDANGQPANGWNLGLFQVPQGEGQFLVPFAIDPVASNQVYAASLLGLYRSQNRGDNWSARLNSTPTDGRPTSISVSPANNNRVWVGTSVGWVYLFDIGASQVTQLGATLPGRYISKVLASPNNANTVYATFSGYNANTPTTPGKVFRSINSGQAWTNISGNLPDVPVSALAINPADENEMWVGTDIGVFQTEDGGATWTSYRGNMPVVAIMDLKYNATTGYLTVATHGRGIWRLRPNAAPASNVVFLPLLARDSVNPPTATATQIGAATATRTRTPTATLAGPTATRTATATATQPGPSPTATRTPTATATRTRTPTATSGALPTVTNGNFEAGQGVGWTENSTNGFNLILNTGLPITPRSGAWLAWLGGGDNETSTLSQAFNIPAGPAIYLSYYYQLYSEETACGFDFAYVYVNATLVATGNLCTSNNILAWTPFSINMGAYSGQAVTVHFQAVTDGSFLSSFFVDDVSFTATLLAQSGVQPGFTLPGQPPE